MAIQRWVLKAMGCAFAVASSAAAVAQDYPNKPVHVVTPFPPGGAADVVLRLVTQRLTEAFKTTFVVDNKAGAGGAIGTEYVARAAADGYTLLLTSSSTMSINPHLGPKSPYDPFTDFTPVIFIGYSPNVLVVTASPPIKSVSVLFAVGTSFSGK